MPGGSAAKPARISASTLLALPHAALLNSERQAGLRVNLGAVQRVHGANAVVVLDRRRYDARDALPEVVELVLLLGLDLLVREPVRLEGSHQGVRRP